MIGAFVVLFTLVLVAPRLLESYRSFDATHFHLGSGEGTGLLRTAFSPLRLLDDLSLVLFLVPLAPLVFLAYGAVKRSEGLPPRAWGFLASLSAPYMVLLVGLDAAQGLFRDFDSFSMSGMAIALWVAAVAAGLLGQEARARWMGVPVLVGAAVPAVLWLVLFTSPERGLRRIEHWIEGPPVRSEALRAKTWDFLGVWYMRAERYPEATRSFRRAVELAPSPRMALEWGTAAESAGDWEAAREAYTLLLERAPELHRFRLTALVGLAKIARRDGDRESFRRLAEAAYEMAPRNRAVLELIRLLESEAPADSLAASPAVP